MSGTHAEVSPSALRPETFAAALDALEDGRSVLVTGPAGIGKSSLLRAVTDHTARPVYRGICYPSTQHVALVPFARLIGPAGGGDALAAAEHVDEALGDRLPVIEDLHWADPDTLLVVKALARRRAIVGSARRSPSADLADEAWAELPLAPLDERAAAVLAAASCPDLDDTELSRHVEAAGGVPLLLVDPDLAPSRTVRDAVRARLRLLDPAELRELALVGMAGQPVPAERVGGSGAAGLLIAVDGGVAPLHSLFGEVAIEVLGAEGCAALLDEVVDIAGPARGAEVAEQVGAHQRAHDLARAAAEDAVQSIELAHALAIVARTAPTTEGRTRAANAAADAYLSREHAQLALDVLPNRGSGDEALDAETNLHRGRALWTLARPTDAAEAITQVLAAVEGTDTWVEAAALIELLRQPTRVDHDAATAMDLARRAIAVCDAAGHERARARMHLGIAHALSLEPGWEPLLIEATRLAEAEGNEDAIMQVGHTHATIEGYLGSPKRAVAIAEGLADRARESGWRRWELLHTVATTIPALMACDYGTVLAAMPDIAVPESDIDVHTAHAVCVVALADTGARAHAEALLAQGRSIDRGDATGQVALLWAEAELALLDGDLNRVSRCATEGMAMPVGAYPPLGWLALLGAWAGVDGCTEVLSALPPASCLAGAADEAQAAERLRSGHRRDTAARFLYAAGRWGPDNRRWQHRCQVAASAGGGSDDLDDACRAAADDGFTALDPWGRRLAERPTVDLSPREREVLRLVAGGLTSSAISASLGIATSTVETHVRQAMTKLGARTRTEAAAIAQRLQG